MFLMKVETYTTGPSEQKLSKENPSNSSLLIDTANAYRFIFHAWYNSLFYRYMFVCKQLLASHVQL